MPEKFTPTLNQWPKKIPLIGEMKGAEQITNTVTASIPDGHEAKIVITNDEMHGPATFMMPVRDIAGFLKRNDLPGLKLVSLTDLGPLEEGEQAETSYDAESRENERPVLVVLRHKLPDGTKKPVEIRQETDRNAILAANAELQNMVSEIEQDPNRPEGKFEVRMYGENAAKLPDWLKEYLKS